MNKKRFIGGLTLIVLGVVAVHLLMQGTDGVQLELKKSFDMEGEQSVTTWFSSILWALAAAAAYRCTAEVTSQRKRFLWRLMVGGLLFLSLDEVASFHERLGDLLRVLVFKRETIEASIALPWVLFFGSLVSAVLIGVVVLVYCLLRDSPRAMSRLFLGIFLVVMGGGVLDMAKHFLNQNPLGWVYQARLILEESLEMFGAIIVLSGLLIHHQKL